MLLSVVAPFYNEVEGLRAFAEELRLACDGLGIRYEVILVDDGSTDGSADTVRLLDWPECSILHLVFNAGHQNALDAGLRASRGAWVVTMDADGQHPPHMVGAMLETAVLGDFEVVYAIPMNRRRDTRFKRNTTLLYYSIMKVGSDLNFHENAADFRLMHRKVVNELNKMPERKIFRLLIPSLGFRSTCVPMRLEIDLPENPSTRSAR